ncbi:MAG: archaeosortase/exosortase family protein [Bacteroidales bacterium]
MKSNFFSFFRKGLLKYYYTDTFCRPIIQVVLFAGITVFFHFLWWNGGLRDFLSHFEAFEAFRRFMVWLVFTMAAWFNESILGMEIIRQGTTIILPGHGFVEVVEDCSGTKQFYQILVLFLLFPGPWKQKLGYIPFSILVMHITNVLRIVFLTLTLLWFPDEWDFVHLYIMRPFFYVVLFVLWIIWVEKFENPRIKRVMEKEMIT